MTLLKKKICLYATRIHLDEEKNMYIQQSIAKGYNYYWIPFFFTRKLFGLV